ncbi:MAG: chromosome partitioning protein ParB [Cyanobacteria bacterium K_Offshore_surface_m2_239]|nr:chromosome partitioning protein ParB [Cyanobacteria bacterium K_Offshore_surface_m2_239]
MEPSGLDWGVSRNGPWRFSAPACLRFRASADPRPVHSAPCAAPVSHLRLPPYQPLPPPDPERELIEVRIADLRPTQMCVGLAEVRSRQRDFSDESADERRAYLASKPVPLVQGGDGAVWMIDRHHRLRGLVEMDPNAIAFGYVVLRLDTATRDHVLEELRRRGWLYLYDGRGVGPHPATALPARLPDLLDDPYRSLVWKLKREKRIAAQPLIPFHEFRWGAWLRSRPLPPFSSERLEPALAPARAMVASAAAAHLAGWTGKRQDA